MNSMSISEIMVNRNIQVISEQASMAELVSVINKNESLSQVYVVDNQGCLLGTILLRDLLMNISPYLLFTDENHKENLLHVMESVDLHSLISKVNFAIREDQNISQVFEKLLLSESAIIPVIDKEKHLIGEVSCNQLLSLLSFNKGVSHHAFS